MAQTFIPRHFYFFNFFSCRAWYIKDLNGYKNSKAYSYHSWLQPLFYDNLTSSNSCILKGECRTSHLVNHPFHILYIILEKQPFGRVMAGMGETCNHVAAAMFRVEAAVCTGLTNPSCTSSANKQLPFRNDIDPAKMKDLNFDREDFAQRGKKKRPLVTSPKKKFNPLTKSDKNHCH